MPLVGFLLEQELQPRATVGRTFLKVQVLPRGFPPWKLKVTAQPEPLCGSGLGGKQLNANLQSVTKVNTIRFYDMTSLRGYSEVQKTLGVKGMKLRMSWDGW